MLDGLFTRLGAPAAALSTFSILGGLCSGSVPVSLVESGRLASTPYGLEVSSDGSALTLGGAAALLGYCQPSGSTVCCSFRFLPLFRELGLCGGPSVGGAATEGCLRFPPRSGFAG